MSKLLFYQFYVSDYEHSGDLDRAKNELLKVCPEAVDIKTWEERDYEAEYDYKDEYGECDEPIYQGFISCNAPKKYKKVLDNLNL